MRKGPLWALTVGFLVTGSLFAQAPANDQAGRGPSDAPKASSAASKDEGKAATTDAAGNPPLYFPIFSEIAGAERAIPIADPLRGFSGDVAVTSSLRLWGVDWNGLVALFRNSNMELTFLLGSRYASLKERLQIQNTTTDLIFNNTEILNDLFATRNQFYGSQIGSRLFLTYDRLTLDVISKLALGVNRQTVDIAGDITQTGPNPLTPPG